MCVLECTNSLQTNEEYFHFLYRYLYVFVHRLHSVLRFINTTSKNKLRNLIGLTFMPVCVCVWDSVTSGDGEGQDPWEIK